MAFQLIGVYDGTQEPQMALRTSYRRLPPRNNFHGWSSTGPFSESLPGAGVNPVLIGVGAGIAGLIAGIWVGRKSTVGRFGDFGSCRRVWVRGHRRRGYAG